MAEEKLALQAILTCCANRTTNVPMYAYAFGLLVFGALLTSCCMYAPNRFTDLGL